MIKRVLFVFFCLPFLFSCKHVNTKEFVNVVAAWEGKTIVYPNNMVFTLWGQDTLDYSMPHIDYTIVSYVDSVGCMSCKLQLLKWKSFISEMTSTCQNRVPVILFFHPKNIEEIICRLKLDKYNYPICIDEKDSLNKLNHFPSDMSFQTFLLDKDNKVLAIGNPVHNPKVKELYLKIIQGKQIGRTDEGKQIKTKVEIDKTAVSMGSFDWQKEQKATFTLKNIGDKPLAIHEVTTSCGCTTVSYPKEPVQPGRETTLEVVYKAEHPEHFDKTVTVYCNADNAPLTLRIGGNAK